MMAHMHSMFSGVAEGYPTVTLSGQMQDNTASLIELCLKTGDAIATQKIETSPYRDRGILTG